MPRLALRLPSIGSSTTTGGAAAGELALAELLADQRQRPPERLELGEHRVLGDPVDQQRHVAARAPRPSGSARARRRAARAAAAAMPSQARRKARQPGSASGLGPSGSAIDQRVEGHAGQELREEVG